MLTTLYLSLKGGLLYQLISRQIEKKFTVPQHILTESTIAQRVTSDIASVDSLGSQVPFNCPACGGVLWKVAGSTAARYRCHTGHAYTAQTLLADQTMKIEETMWTALRMFEERKNLLVSISKDKKGASARSAQERADRSQVHIDRIRDILLSDDKGTQGDIPV